MKLALVILLLLITLQGLAKFAAWILVPYEKRIGQLAAGYARGPRALAIADAVFLCLAIAMVVLLFATDMRYLSFVTGLTVGMILIQLFFHRFNQPLPTDKSPENPETPTPPIKLISYAIQARPGLAWREITLIAALSVWATYMLITRGLLG